MGEQQEGWADGLQLIRTWMEQRFSEADVIYELEKVGRRFRWNIVFGEIGLRMGVTEGVLGSPETLRERLADLERGTWLEDLETKDKWLDLLSVGVVNRGPHEW